MPGIRTKKKKGNPTGLEPEIGAGAGVQSGPKLDPGRLVGKIKQTGSRIKDKAKPFKPRDGKGLAGDLAKAAAIATTGQAVARSIDKASETFQEDNVEKLGEAMAEGVANQLREEVLNPENAIIAGQVSTAIGPAVGTLNARMDEIIKSVSNIDFSVDTTDRQRITGHSQKGVF